MGLKINVTFQEKEDVKSKGAFWDSEYKTWYIPDHKNYNDFIKWIDNEKHPIIAKKPFFVALNSRNCWKCGNLTNVISLASNNFFKFEYVNENDENDLRREWYKQDYFTFFSFPEYIDEEIVNLIQQKFPSYKIGWSKTINDKYWANHCQKCNALQGDFFNHNEPKGAFFPLSIEECKEIILMKVPSKFDLTLNADISFSSISDLIFENCKKVEWE